MASWKSKYWNKPDWNVSEEDNTDEYKMAEYDEMEDLADLIETNCIHSNEELREIRL